MSAEYAWKSSFFLHSRNVTCRPNAIVYVNSTLDIFLLSALIFFAVEKVTWKNFILYSCHMFSKSIRYYFYQCNWRILYLCNKIGLFKNLTFEALYVNCIQITERIVGFTEQITQMKWKFNKRFQIRRFFCSYLTLAKRHILRLRRRVILLFTKVVIFCAVFCAFFLYPWCFACEQFNLCWSL